MKVGIGARLCAAAMAALALQGCQGPLDTRRDDARQELTGPGASRDGESRARTPQQPEDSGMVLDESATLADYLAYGAANSPALRSAFYRWRAAVERIPQARALPDPMVGYGYFLEEFTARPAMEQHVFELSQMFPWFGKLELRGDAAGAMAEAAAHEYEAARLELFLEIRRAYYELYQLGREIELTEENLELLRQFDAIVRARYRGAQAMHADLVRGQVELARLEDRLRQMNQMRQPAMARLNAALNRAADAPVAWPREAPGDRLGVDAAELLATLAKDNPRLRALQSDVERERIETELARREYYPDVTIGAMYALEGDDPLLARFSINLPLWREKYDAAVREAQARRIAAAYMRQDESNRLGFELQEALFEHDDAQRRVELYGSTLLPKARESLQASLTGFQAGMTSFLELLDAERTLLEFQMAESRALADRAIALARLDALTGRPVPRIEDERGEETEKRRDEEPSNPPETQP